MKRTPCALASSPSSCGSMMTKRDLSYSKCRSISGSVPLPIEPKPIMTMGPEIFAWIGGVMVVVSAIELIERRGRTGIGGSGGAPLGGDFDLDPHLGLQKPGDDEQRCGRANIAEPFAADRQYRVSVGGVG